MKINVCDHVATIGNFLLQVICFLFLMCEGVDATIEVKASLAQLHLQTMDLRILRKCKKQVFIS